MALSIKTPEADELARELAELTHESLSQAVTTALRQRLERLSEPSELISRRVRRLRDEYAAQIVDHRTSEEIIGYDEHGLPT